jgi:hypothetical protein
MNTKKTCFWRKMENVCFKFFNYLGSMVNIIIIFLFFFLLGEGGFMIIQPLNTQSPYWLILTFPLTNAKVCSMHAKSKGDFKNSTVLIETQFTLHTYMSTKFQGNPTTILKV